jgi:hypothetical protein
MPNAVALLRVRREWPSCCGAAKPRHEIAPSHFRYLALVQGSLSRLGRLATASFN